MPRKYFQPRTADRAGAQVIITEILVPTITANTTTTVRVPTPFRRAWIERIAIHNGTTTGADADGTILATFNRRDNIAGANVALTAATSLEADFLTATNKVFNVPLLSTLTEPQREIKEGDALYVDIVNNSAAIDTQPAQLHFVIELLVRE